MKLRNRIPTFVVVSILVISLTYTISITSQTPSTVIKTGDTFTFTNNEWQITDSFRTFEMGDSYNPSNKWYDEESNWENTTSEGQAELFFVRDRPTLPTFPGVDTFATVDSWSQNQPGSERGGEHNQLHYDQYGNLTWFNNTYPIEDISYQRYESHEEVQEFSSNATYALIFPEMSEDIFSLDFGDCDGPDCGGPVPGMNGNLTLQNRLISNVYHEIWINSNFYNLSVTEIWSEFAGSDTGNMPYTVWMGDMNDPNSLSFDVTLFYSYLITVQHNVHYDISTGLPISIETFFHLEFATWFEEYYVPMIGEDGTTYYNNISSYSDGVMDSYRGNFMVDASSFYGQIRTVSSGTNRLMEGDILRYNFSSENYQSMNMYLNIPTSQGTMTRNEDQWGNSDTQGVLLFDVFRHNPGYFEAIIYMEGQEYGEEYWNLFDTEGGTNNYNSWNNTWGPHPSMMIDDFFAYSDTQFEIVPFFDDQMYVNMGGNDNCDGSDCGFQLPIQNGIPKQGPVNDTTWYINLLDMNDGPNEGFVINGYTYTEFNVHEMSQMYYLMINQTIEIPLGDGQDGQPPLLINATMGAVFEGKQSFFYDDDTGAMIVMEQYTRTEVYINAYEYIWMDYGDGDGTGEYVWIDFSLNLSADSHFNLFLIEHPNLYQTAPTIISTTTTTPPTTSTPTTSTPTTSTPTTSTPPTTSTEPASNSTSTSTTDEDTAPGLPIPAPFYSVLAGMLVTTLIIKKRN